MVRWFWSLLTLLLIAGCLFDTDTKNAGDYFAEQNLAHDVAYHSFSLTDIKPLEVNVGRDTLKVLNPGRLHWGNVRDVHQSAFFRFEINEEWLTSLVEEEKLELHLTPDTFYYNAEYVEQSAREFDIVPVRISWDLEIKSDEDDLRENTDIDTLADSLWMARMQNMESSVEAQLIGYLDDEMQHLRLAFPQELIDELLAEDGLEDGSDAGRLHLRIDAADSVGMVRFGGYGSYTPPFVLVVNEGDSISDGVDKLAQMAWVDEVEMEEYYGSGLVLHSAVRESLSFSLPDSLWESLLAELNLDQDENAEKLVVLSAVLSLASDDAQGWSEWSAAIPLYSYGELDSLNSEQPGDYFLEAIHVDSAQVEESNKPNLLLAGRDSVSLQYSSLLRFQMDRWLKGEETNTNMIVKMGFPVLRTNDAHTYNYYDDNGDLIKVNAEFADYSAYNFGLAEDLRFSLDITIADFGGQDQ